MSRTVDPRPAADAIRQLLNDQVPTAITYLIPPAMSVERATPDPVPVPITRPVASSPETSTPNRKWHTPDFSSVRWPDASEPDGFKVYSFSPKQRPIVALLWEAMENGTHFVGTAALLETAEIDSAKLSDVFRGNEAWKRLIIPGWQCGGASGTYRLAPRDANWAKDGAE